MICAEELLRELFQCSIFLELDQNLIDLIPKRCSLICHREQKICTEVSCKNLLRYILRKGSSLEFKSKILLVSIKKWLVIDSEITRPIHDVFKPYGKVSIAVCQCDLLIRVLHVPCLDCIRHIGTSI